MHRRDKQQERQTELYNLRGAPVDVGDRVLLANKGERRCRKLADSWESHLYTVVEKQENTHTFKIRNGETGQVKVVHRNLIMPVNFLPVPTEPEDCGSSVSVLTVVEESVLDVGMNLLCCLSVDLRTGLSHGSLSYQCLL